MNLSSQQNYQTYIGQQYNMSDNNDLLSLNNNFNQDQQLNAGYGSSFNQLNELVKPASVLNRSHENDTDENDFDNETLISKIDNDQTKRQKKLIPIMQQKVNYYPYNQSITGSSISSSSSSTSSSPLSLSSPLHSNIHFNHQSHLNIQLKQAQSVQSHPVSSTTLNSINNYQQTSNIMPISSSHQSFLYNDPNTSNMFSYHSINKMIPINENQQFPNHDLSTDSNVDEFNSRPKIKKSKKDPITEYDLELAESIEFELGLKKQNGPRKNSWGNLSYAELITRAIESSCDQRLTLSQIYDWIVKYVPYFKEKFDRTSSAGWKNSIRHNLSLHNRFIRVQNESSGKSSWWMINPDITKYSLNPMSGNTVSGQSGNNFTDNDSFIEPTINSSMIDSNNNLKMNLNENNTDNCMKLMDNSTSLDNKTNLVKDMKPMVRRLNGSMHSSQKLDQSRLSPSSTNYTSVSPSSMITKSSCADLTNKRSKITKHKLNMCKLNKNNIMYKNKIKKQDTQMDTSLKNSNFDIKIDNNTTKCDNLMSSQTPTCSSAASSSSTPSSSMNNENNSTTVSLTNDLMANRTPFSSLPNTTLLQNTENLNSLTAITTSPDTNLKKNMQQVIIGSNEPVSSSTPSNSVSYQNYNNSSSSILRAALQKTVSNNINSMSGCSTLNSTSSSNPPTPTATPTLVNQTNFNNSQNSSKQFYPNNNYVQLQSNAYNFNPINQIDNTFGYQAYQNNSFNSSSNNIQQFINLHNPPNVSYVSNENSYFTNINNNQMIVPSPGSSISTSSSPTSSTSSSSSSLTTTMSYLNRSNNINTQPTKSKSPLVSTSQQQEQFTNNFNLTHNPQMQGMNYSNSYNNQQTFDTNQRLTNFVPLTNATSLKPTYYDLNKNMQQTGQNTALASNSCGGQLNHTISMYDDLNSCYYD